MNIYYIDYENVSSQGLKGIETLTENDEVNLLYSKKADNVKIEMLTMLLASKARIHFLPVHVGTPNALDFQLVTLLFLNYKNSDYCYIISKDSGYDCCIKTAAENGAPNVARFPNIESAVKGITTKKTRRGKRVVQDTENQNNGSKAKDNPQIPPQPQENAARPSQEQPPMQNNERDKEQKEIAQTQKENAQAQAHKENAQTPAHKENAQAQAHKENAQEPAHKENAQTSARKENTQASAHKENTQASAHKESAQAQDQKETAQEHAPEQTTSAADDVPKKKPSRRRGRKKAAPEHSEPESSANIPGTPDQPTVSSEKEAAAQSAETNERPEAADKKQEAVNKIPETADKKQETVNKKPAGTDNKPEQAIQSDDVIKKSSDDNEKPNDGIDATEKPEEPVKKEPVKKAPVEHVLQQRYLSKQFDPKGLQADKAKSEADKPVSILSVIRRRNDVQLDMHQIDLIRNALNNSKNKQQFYSYFVKQLGQKQGIELYHSVKSSYTDLVNANLL